MIFIDAVAECWLIMMKDDNDDEKKVDVKDGMKRKKSLIHLSILRKLKLPMITQLIIN